MDKTEVARRGEDAAAAYLERAGMCVVDRNWRTKGGEIDIIALDGETLVLVEVKTRRTDSHGSPEDAVTATKQKRLLRLAESYIAHTGLDAPDVRFDVIAVRPIAEDRALLRHHQAAFCIR